MPATYAAFLRGINLGRRRVTGPELQSVFTGLGFADVATFLASGNVVFDPGPGVHPRELEPRLEEQLELELGYAVPVFLRSEAELAALVAREPFTPADLQRSAGKLQVVLLREPPSKTVADAVLAQTPPDDRLALHGRELFWLPASTMSSSDLDLTALDRLLGGTTTRTHNTLTRLLHRFFAP